MYRTLAKVMFLFCIGCTGAAVDDTDLQSETGDSDTNPGPLLDVDQDGYASDIDCDDYNPMIYPGADEKWDFKDNDCDGRVDGDGSYTGTTTLKFSVIYEGKLNQWNVPCSGQVQRATNQISIDLTCLTSSLESELATKVMGAEIVVREVDNVAEQAVWGGEVRLDSTADWSTDGAASLVWVSWDRISGEMNATAQNLSVAGSWSFEYEVP
jgi:hypothetical protein